MKEWKSWCILSISCSFMFFMFAPLEVYLTNIQEFWFYVKDLFPTVFACFVLADALLITAGFLLKKTRIFPYAAAVFVCLYIGFYVQGNLMCRNYGALDRNEIDWAQYSHYGVRLAVLWVVMLILCIFLCLRLSRYIYIVCQYTGIVISLILMATLATLYFQNIHYEEDKNAVAASQKNMFSVSDIFDASYLREILKYCSSGFEREEEAGDIYTVDGKAEILTDDKSWDKFSLYGVADLETAADGKAYRWTCERVSIFRFCVKDADRNYRMFLNYSVKFQDNSVDGIKVKINDRELPADAVKVEDNQIQMDIASEFIAESGVTVIIEFQNTASPKELGIGDDIRKMSVALLGVSIEGYAHGYDLSDSSAVESKTDVFVGDAEWDALAIQGMGDLETDSDDHMYRWTTEDEVEFLFYVEDIPSNGYRFYVNYDWVLTDESLNDIYAECNGENADVTIQDENQLVIQIPAASMKGYQGDVVLHFPHAASPKELGINDDERKLSIAVRSIRFEKF